MRNLKAMNNFNRLFEHDRTRVLINGSWYVVKQLHETRKWIEVYGLMGSFQRGHVERFSNKVMGG